MNTSSYLDKSKTQIITKLLTSANVYTKDFIHSTKKLANEFPLSLWFAQSLKEKNIVDFLEYTTKGTEVQALLALLYAFAHPGTTNALLGLCKALFGQGSIVSIQQSTPCVVDLTINGTSTQFMAGLITLDGKALTSTPDNKWITGDVYSNLGTTDIEGFLYRFIPLGYKLNLKVNMNT